MRTDTCVPFCVLQAQQEKDAAIRAAIEAAAADYARHAAKAAPEAQQEQQAQQGAGTGKNTAKKRGARRSNEVRASIPRQRMHCYALLPYSPTSGCAWQSDL